MSMATTSRSAARTWPTSSQSQEKYDRPWTIKIGVRARFPAFCKRSRPPPSARARWSGQCSSRKRTTNPGVDRREVGRRFAHQVRERIDVEVGLLVAVDLVFGAHDALEVEREPARARVVDAGGELAARGEQPRAIRPDTRGGLHEAELDR